MSPPDNAAGTKTRLSLLNTLRQTHARARPQQATRRSAKGEPVGSYDFSRHSAYSEVKIARAAGETLALASPFFRVAEKVKPTELKINGRWVKNFASYDYLSLNQSKAVRSSVKGRVDDWGISATASRLVGGERSGQVERLAVEIDERHVAGLVHLATVEQGSQGGFPPDPVRDVPRGQLHARGQTGHGY